MKDDDGSGTISGGGEGGESGVRRGREGGGLAVEDRRSGSDGGVDCGGGCGDVVVRNR